MIVRLAFIGLATLIACGPLQEPQTSTGGTPTAVPSASAVPSSPPLFEVLRQLNTPAPVLDALPLSVRERLKQFGEQLSEQQRSAVLDPAQGVWKARPLLFMSLGGEDLGALHALVASTLATDELLTLVDSEEALPPLVEVSNELVRRAAGLLLRGRAADFSPGREVTVATLEQVAQAAATLERRDIELMALTALRAREDSPERMAALAVVHAERLEVQPAQAILKELQQKGESQLVTWLSGAVEAASTVVALAEQPTVDEVVAAGRAYLSLGQDKEALTVLQRFAGLRGSHLALAVTWARAELGGTSCPHVLRGNPVLCRTAWQLAQQRRPLAAMSAAFKTGNGQDAAALESYLGLRFVVPMLYRLDEAGAQAAAPVLIGQLQAVEQGARAAVHLGGHLEGVALFAESLRTAFQAALAEDRTSPRPVIAPQVRRALLDKGTQLMGSLGKDTWGQAAALATMALTAQDEAIGPQLDAMATQLLPPYRVGFGALSLWTALADGSPKRLSGVRGLLMEVVKDQAVVGVARSKWLVTWAEAEAHLKPSERAYADLEAMATKLKDPRIPLSLRLRAALNLAGIHARRGNLELAVGALEKIVKETPKSVVSSRSEQELLITANGYLTVLKARKAKGKEQRELVTQLQAFLVEVNKKSAAPGSLLMWLALWRDELALAPRIERCGKRAACLRRVRRARGVGYKQLTQTLGARTAELMKRGVLPIGGVQLEFRYENDGRIAPVVQLESRFPLVETPPLE